jgi:predicted RNase H-like HicB family nuclease
MLASVFPREPLTAALHSFDSGCYASIATINLEVMEIQFTTRIFKEGRTFVAHALELDVSSCGGTKEKALRNLKEAVRLFLEEAEKMDTLEQILEEAGYARRKQKIVRPPFISVQRVTLPLPLTHAKA